MFEKLVNIGKNSLKRQNLRVMSGKALTRIKERRYNQETDDVIKWCKIHAEPYDVFLKSLNEDLWNETLNACQSIKEAANKKLVALGLDMGGGGNYPILYFFTRHLNAHTIVETGVAAGWSSQSILLALNVNNNKGQLYSSDFPYFRYDNPEKLVGYIVDEALKENWHLYIDGDQNNIPKIAGSIDQIDLFHYEVNKSYSGRNFALNALKDKLTHDTVMIFDDIQDNFHFRDHVEQNALKFKVFEFEGKYVGIIAPFL